MAISLIVCCPGAVTSISCQNHIMFTSSLDKTVRLWTIATGSVIKTIKSPAIFDEPILCMSLNNNAIAIGGSGGSVQVIQANDATLSILGSIILFPFSPSHNNPRSLSVCRFVCRLVSPSPHGSSTAKRSQASDSNPQARCRNHADVHQASTSRQTPRLWRRLTQAL